MKKKSKRKRLSTLGRAFLFLGRILSMEVVFLRKLLHNFAMILLDIAIILFCVNFIVTVLG